MAPGSDFQPMRRFGLRFFFPFVSGVLAASVAILITGGASSRAASRYKDLSLFTSILNLVRNNYVKPVDEHQLIRGAVNGMLQELDPHSAFMDAAAYKAMQVDQRGEFHALGI